MLASSSCLFKVHLTTKRGCEVVRSLYSENIVSDHPKLHKEAFDQNDFGKISLTSFTK